MEPGRLLFGTARLSRGLRAPENYRAGVGAELTSRNGEFASNAGIFIFKAWTNFTVLKPRATSTFL